MTQKEIETLFRQHYTAMYRLARTILYDADESKDVVSDVFVRLLHNNPSVQVEKMEGYLMMAVRNRCLDVLSHKSVREQVEKLFSEELKQRHIIARNEDERKSKDEVYSLTPARCRKVKRRCHRKGSIKLKPR